MIAVSKKGLWLMHFVANAALAFLAYQWLWIPDRTAWQVALSAVTGVGLFVFTLWLHGATLAYFHAAHAANKSDGTKPRVAWATARRLPALIVWAVVLIAVLNVILLLMGYREPVSNVIASWLTLRFRRPVSPFTVSSVYGWLVWLAAYFKVPLLLLPWAESAAVNGFGAFGLRRILTPAKTALHPRYWLTCIVAFIAGVAIPALLVHWAPEVAGIPAQTVSLVIRFLLAYAMIVTSWLFLASALSSHRMRNDGDAGQPPISRG